MRASTYPPNLNWIWSRLETGGLEGWSRTIVGKLHYIVRKGDGARWCRHSGLGHWAPVPPPRTQTPSQT